MSEILGKGVAAILGLALVIGIFMGAIAGFQAFGRYQNIQDAKNKAQANIIAANNQVEVSNIEIQNQAQRVQIAKQQAEIRLQDAIGVREAQDEIAKTLTPIYVQYEMTQALERIAESGKNNTVVYVPSGQGGIPTITAQAGTGK
jgi:hypothetical protein